MDTRLFSVIFTYSLLAAVTSTATLCSTSTLPSLTSFPNWSNTSLCMLPSTLPSLSTSMTKESQ